MKYESPPGVVMSDTVQVYDPAFVKPLLGKYPVAVVVPVCPLKKVAVPATTKGLGSAVVVPLPSPQSKMSSVVAVVVSEAVPPVLTAEISSSSPAVTLAPIPDCCAVAAPAAIVLLNSNVVPFPITLIVNVSPVGTLAPNVKFIVSSVPLAGTV